MPCCLQGPACEILRMKACQRCTACLSSAGCKNGVKKRSEVITCPDMRWSHTLRHQPSIIAGAARTMCGISLLLAAASGDSHDKVALELHDIAGLLRRRGPDHLGVTQVQTHGCQLHILASLLQLRGSSPSQAPLTATLPTQDGGAAPASCQAVLAYNGEVFGGLPVQAGHNDGQVLMQAMCVQGVGHNNHNNLGEPGSSSSSPLVKVLSQLQGPWSIIFWDPTTSTVWFGRDVLGRRSLLMRWPSTGHPHLTLTSVVPRPTSHDSVQTADNPSVVTGSTPAATTHASGPSPPSTITPPEPGQQTQQTAGGGAPKHGSGSRGGAGRGGDGGEEDGDDSSQPVPTASTWQPWCHSGWQEVPPGLYSLTCSTTPSSTETDNQGLQPVVGPHSSSSASTRDAGGVPVQTVDVLPDQHHVCIAGTKWLFKHHPWVDTSIQQLASYTRPATMIHPPGAEHSGPPPPGSVPLSNAAALQQAQKAAASSTTGNDDPGCQVASEDAWKSYGVPIEAIDAVVDALRQAVQVRCDCIENHTPHPFTPVPSLTPAPVQGTTAAPTVSGLSPDAAQLPTLADAVTADANAHTSSLPDAPLLILFSGGVDSTLLAALAHQCLPPGVPIDLSNVCFDGGRSPDRQAALHALQELSRYAPDRQWRLIQVDSSLAEVDKHQSHLLHLLHPAGTVMDLNIGAALWLAVKAHGKLLIPSHPNAQGNDCNGQMYCSRARVVFLGHGADEQCAGYGRHRSRFAAGGWPALSDELAFDVKRLWLRNLGRDDRLVADWGREGRHPFLDEAFMSVLLNVVPLHVSADLCLIPGLGDKRVLRAALARLGLVGAAARIKRAIQFGTRIGKHSNKREFGSNRAANRFSAGAVALSQLSSMQLAAKP